MSATVPTLHQNTFIRDGIISPRFYVGFIDMFRLNDHSRCVRTSFMNVHVHFHLILR